MSNLIYRRIAGYIFTICLYVTNAVIIHNTLLPPKNEKLAEIDSLMWQFFTIWNVVFQVLYAIYGLTCDILTLRNYEKVSRLISLREKIFSYVIWPSTFMVATIFWPIFLYDRSLVYPEFIDEGIPPCCNYIMHVGILVVLFWEFLHLPRREQMSHKTGVIVVTMIYASYFTWIIYSQSVNGLWPYPLFKMFYGTIYFPIIMLALYLVVIVSYFHQWPLVYLVWGRPMNEVD